MSLSRDPAFSLLKSQFVCGITDITGKNYAGSSGTHALVGKSIDTSNGAGPHNIQIFVLSPDGTVLHCLPGFWSSTDLVHELKLAQQLNWLWQSSSYTPQEKSKRFREMHIAHQKEHPQEMVDRSVMQYFDQEYEASNKLQTSDVILDPKLIMASKDGLPQEAFKTVDRLMHERMSQRPFVAYDKFDIASYSDYGLPSYDKSEDRLDLSGNVDETTPIQQPAEKIERHSVVQDYRWKH